MIQIIYLKTIQLNISNYLTKPLNLNQLIDVTNYCKINFLEKRESRDI